MSKSSNPIKRDTSIPRRPLLWMAAALLFTLPPFFDSLAIWVPWLFLLSLALKFWMEPRGYRLRSVVLKLMLVAMAVTTVFVSYGSVRGVEAGISLLVVLASLKILEAHTAREFRVMGLIGWMLCLCGFFLSQDLTTALCLLIAFGLLAVALISFIVERHRARSGLRLLRRANSSFKPRRLSSFSFFCFPESILDSGLNSSLPFGKHRLFRSTFSWKDRSPCKFFGDRVPRGVSWKQRRPSGPMYWRGVVMWRCDGMEWQAPYEPRSKTPSTTLRRRGQPQPLCSISKRQGNPTADHASAARRALDVCTLPPD